MVCAAENSTDREEEASPEEKGGWFRKGTEPTAVLRTLDNWEGQPAPAGPEVSVHRAQPDKAAALSPVLRGSCGAPLPQLPLPPNLPRRAVQVGAIEAWVHDQSLCQPRTGLKG